MYAISFPSGEGATDFHGMVKSASIETRSYPPIHKFPRSGGGEDCELILYKDSTMHNPFYSCRLHVLLFKGQYSYFIAVWAPIDAQAVVRAFEEETKSAAKIYEKMEEMLKKKEVKTNYMYIDKII